MSKILIVDDEVRICQSLKQALENRGHECVTAGSFVEGQQFASAPFDIVFLDVMLGDGSGLDLLDEILARVPERPVVMISGHADVDTAVTAIHKGAYDFIEKPVSMEKVMVVIENATRTTSLRSEKNRLAGIVYGEMVGQSEAIRKLTADIVKSAGRVKRFLILGENGTGKELVAHLIHRHGTRTDGPFVAVNCAALPSELVESELFGHVKGAFTGATSNRIGKFIEANGGTIFLDEISEMPMEAQAKILRVTESEQLTPVGSNKVLPVDCTIIAASNSDLEKQVALSRFRQDLYYRLNVITFNLPPLRERLDDIPLLADYFLSRFANEGGVVKSRFNSDAYDLLKKLSYQGNIRELRNLVERISIYCDKSEISAVEIKPFLPSVPSGNMESLKDATEKFEKEFIRSAFLKNGGNMTDTARKLGLERSHLYKKIKKLGLEL